MSTEQWQLRFDWGRQQRYFSDRRALLECVERVSRQSPDPRFEIWVEGSPVLLADGRHAGRRYELVEVLDLQDSSVRERLKTELIALRQEGDPS
jgi:hypothetical protein